MISCEKYPISPRESKISFQTVEFHLFVSTEQLILMMNVYPDHISMLYVAKLLRNGYSA